MSKIKNENYVVIQGWMVNELNLKGNDLMVYAIIYGFTQITGQLFNGSLSYLAEWCNSSVRGIEKNLKSLIDKGLIKKQEKYLNNVKYCYYETLRGMEQSSMGYGTKFHGGMEQSSNNNIDNKSNNRLIDFNNIELQNFFQEKQIFISADMKNIMTEEKQKYFYKLQEVITEIYKSPVYKKYIYAISYDDLAMAYEKCCNAKNVKNDIAYMKRILLEKKRKEATA